MFYNPNKAIHPGRVVLRTLEREGMTQKNLSERTGLTEKHISQIVNGEASITVETSLLLENALGGTASFWINLEKNYQEIKARLERYFLVRKEISLISKFPYNELAKRGYVEQTSNKNKKVENLWKFFGVNSLLYIKDTEAVAYRKKENAKIKSEYIATWLRCGEIESKKIDLQPYSESQLRQSLEKIKNLTTKSADEFSVEIKKILAQSGVALVYSPHFSGTKVNGAMRWVGDNPVLQVSLLGAYADIFWFTVFHEIGHILLHGKKEKFLEFDERSLSLVQDKEKEADEFAGNMLIPQKEYIGFIQKSNFSLESIKKFSSEVGVHPGIIAGRLCHDRWVNWSNISVLRSRLRFVNHNN